MKVLFIGHGPEEDKNVLRLMGNNYPKVQLVGLKRPEDLSDMLTDDGPFSFIIISIDNKNISTESIYQQINETLGTRPFVFIGTPNSVKSQLTNSIISNQQTNALVELPMVLEEFK